MLYEVITENGPKTLADGIRTEIAAVEDKIAELFPAR